MWSLDGLTLPVEHFTIMYIRNDHVEVSLSEFDPRVSAIHCRADPPPIGSRFIASLLATAIDSHTHLEFRTGHVSVNT